MSARARRTRVRVCTRARLVTCSLARYSLRQNSAQNLLSWQSNYSALIEMKALELGRGPLMGEWRQGCGLCLCITL